MASKISIVFVIGAWHSEFHIKPIQPYLEQSGYRVVPVKLRTSGKHDPLPVVQDNVDQVLDILRAEVDAGYGVCMLGHSVSGQSVVAAVNEFLKTASAAQKARLLHIILISCFFDPVRSLVEQDWYEVDMETFWVAFTRPIEDVFYNDMPREESRPFVDALDANRGQMPPAISEEWKSVKATYFLCTKDQAIPPKFQRMEAEENGLEVVELEMDHCPMVSRPKELAGEMDKLLQGYK